MKKIIFIVLLFAANSLLATNYYISSSDGNDDNDGLAPESAWETLSKIYAFSLLPGDVVHFKRGDVWYNQTLKIRYSGTEGNPITYTDYGTGDLPEISGMGTLDSTIVWTDEGSNIWSRVIDYTIVPGWNIYYKLQRLYIDEEEVLSAAIDIPGEIGTNVPDLIRFHYEIGTQTLKLYSEVDPNSLKIEFAFQQYALYFAWWAGTDDKIQFIDIENLKFSGGNVACVSILAGININVSNLDVGDKGNFGIIINGGEEVSQNIIIDSCLIDSRYNFDYSEAGTTFGKSDRGPREGLYGRWSTNVEVKNSTFKDYTHANINLQQYVDGKYCEYYNIHDNYSTSSIAYGGRTVVDRGTYFLEFYNNTIDGSNVQNQLLGQNNHFHHNIIKDVKSSPLKHYHSGFGIFVYPYSGESVLNNVYENNLIINCESGAINVQNNRIGDNYYVVENCIFRNNILVNNGKFVPHFTGYPQNQNSNINLAIKITDPYDWDSHIFVSPTTSNNIFQNNLIYVDSGMAKILYHLNDDDPNGWTTATINVEEFNGKNGENDDLIGDIIEADPLFVDLLDADYHLQSISPAVNAGILPLADEDFDGNAIPFPGTLPDIGIYEYQDVSNINEYSKNDGFIIYPNPTTNKIQIKNLTGTIERIQIFDITGNLCGEFTNAQNIQLNNLPAGTYVLRIVNDMHVEQKKFIIQ